MKMKKVKRYESRHLVTVEQLNSVLNEISIESVLRNLVCKLCTYVHVPPWSNNGMIVKNNEKVVYTCEYIYIYIYAK